ncbi:siphovirus Gp157 family protein [Limosilactobacillus mucosae]|uniref:siphovirus Gp157 family protein n=1 Tax=Limosilactobacillus mucosae TaxID=97478 RepID=UPI0022E572C2|nr:siphovirus Gp157 family protein [Limosilactobacillus mucosae]
MANLFTLNDQYKELSARDDLDPQVLVDTLDAIDDDRKTKLDNLATWADQLKAEIDFIDEKIKTWKDEKTYRQNKLAWIKQYMTDVMDDAGIKKLQTDNHMLSTRNFKASTVIDDEDKLPSTFVTQVTETKPDKRLIYQALKAGEKVPGAHLKANRNTVIK